MCSCARARQRFRALIWSTSSFIVSVTSSVAQTPGAAWAMGLRNPMWGLANLARLLGWFLALLYSECLAALARPRVLPESLPAWLVEGAHRHRAREIPTALARVLTPRPSPPRAQATATTARASPRSSRARAPASVASSCRSSPRAARTCTSCVAPSPRRARRARSSRRRARGRPSNPTARISATLAMWTPSRDPFARAPPTPPPVSSRTAPASCARDGNARPAETTSTPRSTPSPPPRSPPRSSTIPNPIFAEPSSSDRSRTAPRSPATRGVGRVGRFDRVDRVGRVGRRRRDGEPTTTSTNLARSVHRRARTFPRRRTRVPRRR